MKSATFQAFVRFSLVGFAGLLIDLAVLYAAALELGWYGARLLSFLAAATATWWLNRHYTFASPAMGHNQKSIFREYINYLTSMSLGGSINYLLYAITIALLSSSTAPLMGVVLGSCGGLIFNFLLAKNFVFKNK